MSLGRIGSVVRKEVREFRRNRFVISTMAVLPFIFLITPIITLFRVPNSASGTQVERAVGVTSLLLLIVPLVIPPVIASYSVVGERVQGTLEPVLTTPLRRDELLLGKAVAAFLPSVAIAYALYFVAAVAMRIGAAHVVSAVVWHPPEMLAQILFTPLLAGWSIWVGIGISARAKRRPRCPAARDAGRAAAARFHLPHQLPADQAERPAGNRPRARPPCHRRRCLVGGVPDVRPRAAHHRHERAPRCARMDGTG